MRSHSPENLTKQYVLKVFGNAAFLGSEQNENIEKRAQQKMMLFWFVERFLSPCETPETLKNNCVMFFKHKACNDVICCDLFDTLVVHVVYVILATSRGAEATNTLQKA